MDKNTVLQLVTATDELVEISFDTDDDVKVEHKKYNGDKIHTIWLNKSSIPDLCALLCDYLQQPHEF